MNSTRLTRAVVTVIGTATLSIGTALSGAAVATAAPADKQPQWEYIGQYQEKSRCEEAIGAYQGRPDTADFRCIYNGKPASQAAGTWSLYRIGYY